VVTPILELSTSGVGCLDTSILFRGSGLVVEYGYETEDGTWTGAVRFEHVAAFRYADEAHTNPFPQEAYDAVVEVHESEWLKAHRGPGTASPQWPFSKRHLAVFFSSSGYLEVIAERVEALAPTLRHP
jgi:hypothetical protein